MNYHEKANCNLYNLGGLSHRDTEDATTLQLSSTLTFTVSKTLLFYWFHRNKSSSSSRKHQRWFCADPDEKYWVTMLEVKQRRTLIRATLHASLLGWPLGSIFHFLVSFQHCLPHHYLLHLCFPFRFSISHSAFLSFFTCLLACLLFFSKLHH